MKDTELRGLVLQKYYDKRRDGLFDWVGCTEEEVGPELIAISEDIFRICDQLAEHGLIEWHPVQDGIRTVAGMGQINAFGVDVVEGEAKSPITITFDHSRTVSISGSNNIVGDHNSLSVETINTAISHSSFSEAEKAEAKSLWQKVSENKLLNTVIGSVLGAATKHALETTTPTR